MSGVSALQAMLSLLLNSIPSRPLDVPDAVVVLIGLHSGCHSASMPNAQHKWVMYARKKNTRTNINWSKQ